MKNMPILYINIIDGLPSQLARDAFLWATDRPGNDRMCYKAERFAEQVHAIVSAIKPMMQMSADIYSRAGIGDGGVSDGLIDFILKRHANMEFGGNVSPDYAA